MTHLLLDTDVVSHLYGNCSEAQALKPMLDDAVLAVAFPTIAEMHHAAWSTAWGDSRTSRLDTYLRRYLTLSSDNELPRVWGRLRAQAARSGHPLAGPEHDNALWVAASAVRYKMALLTETPELYRGLPGLEVVNPDP